MADMTSLSDGTNTYNVKDANALHLGGGTMTGAINMGTNKITNIGDPTEDGDAVNKAYVDDLVPTNFAPKIVGTILLYAGSTAPEGYLICDGSAVSRTTYEKLFTAIGTVYGEGDGTTTFNLPDISGRVPVGVSTDYTLSSVGGEKTHTLMVNEMPEHNHNVYSGYVGNSDTDINVDALIYKSLLTAAHYKEYGSYLGVDNPVPFIANTGAGDPHNNMQPYIVLNYIICTGI